MKFARQTAFFSRTPKNATFNPDQVNMYRFVGPKGRKLSGWTCLEALSEVLLRESTRMIPEIEMDKHKKFPKASKNKLSHENRNRFPL